jgi:hypothetical protein
METGFANVVRLIVTLVASYLIPIAISCLTYLSLIWDKARVGKNSIDVQNKTHPNEENDISDLGTQIRTLGMRESQNHSLKASVSKNSDQKEPSPLHNIIVIRETDSYMLRLNR